MTKSSERMWMIQFAMQLDLHMESGHLPSFAILTGDSRFYCVAKLLTSC